MKNKKGKYNRYSFVKKMNMRSLILLKDKKRYISFDKDLEILKFINFNFKYQYCNLNYLDNYGINYIVLDNLEIIENKEYNINNYMKYLKLMYLKKILVNIGNN